jgi:hypothetical protein
MQIQDFVKVYEGKPDEELVQLAAALEQLTPEAGLALQSELSRRQISVAEHSGASQNDGKRDDSGYVSVKEKWQTGQRQGVGDFVVEASNLSQPFRAVLQNRCSGGHHQYDRHYHSSQRRTGNCTPPSTRLRTAWAPHGDF